jgi:plastocyanin
MAFSRRSLFVALGLVLVIGALVAGCSGGDDGQDEASSPSPTTAAPVATAVPTAAPPTPTPIPGSLPMVIANFAFTPASFTAPAGQVILDARNDDFASHTFTIDGIVDATVFGSSQSPVQFTIAAGSYRFYCKIHAQNATMQGMLTVQ